MKGLLLNRIRLEFDENYKLQAFLHTNTLDEAEHIADASGVTCEISAVSGGAFVEGTSYEYCIKWSSTEAIDMLSKLNKGVGLYSHVLTPVSPTNLVCTFKRSNELAVSPTRAYPSDSGFDLTLIAPVKTTGDVTFYTTAIQVDPPHGYYFDLVARSSLSKTGYMIANAFGIIDQNYRGDIIVALRKVDPSAKDIELPAKVVQLIPRQWFDISMKEISTGLSSHGEQWTTLGQSSRGEGGFGSTNI